MDYLPEAARVLKPGGQITISGSRNNKYTKIKASLLDELGLEVVERPIPLPERFSQYKFFQVDGITEVGREKILTTTLRKKG
ncbi:hypothetical protein Q5692_38550 [Microcoleus sp. C2C3]|uniref:hypothetical protein n=1 Tax=unclassified Microcoleus TaxID=2642155 RepID=UPI002FD64CA8